MDKKIVLVGAGSAMFGPPMLTDLSLSKVLGGSTIVLHDINTEKLEIMYDIVLEENKHWGDKFNIERTTKRADAFKDADFIISSIEVGDRGKLWMQDYDIPKKHGSTQILGECGGPGGSIHAFRIIPQILDIVKDAERCCHDAFFINFSNPMARVCLAIKRIVKNLKFIGLCHQIGFMVRYLPKMFNKPIEDLKMKTAGLNHFAFLLGLEELTTGKDLMPEFNEKALEYFTKHENRFEFSTLTFEVYKRYGWWPYVGDNHLGEYIQFGEEFTKTQDMVDWIDLNDRAGNSIYKKFVRMHKRLKRGAYPEKGILSKKPTGERAVPIIEAILTNKNSYEAAVNVPNDGIVENLPQDLILECPVTVDKDGVHSIKIGNLPKNIAALLRIEATVQDLCVDAILNKSKEQAINALAIDPNVGSFEMAEKIFEEVMSIKEQRQFLDYLK